MGAGQVPGLRALPRVRVMAPAQVPGGEGALAVRRVVRDQPGRGELRRERTGLLGVARRAVYHQRPRLQRHLVEHLFHMCRRWQAEADDARG